MYHAATGVYSIRLPKNRLHGTKQRNGRSAAFGHALLLRGLARGTHTIHSNGSLGGHKGESNVTVHVR